MGRLWTSALLVIVFVLFVEDVSSNEGFTHYLPQVVGGIEAKENGDSGSCVPYTLENTECYHVVGPFVYLPTGPNLTLQYLFDQIALSVSDVRMYPEQCRRSIIYGLCNKVFVTCSVNLTASSSPDDGDISYCPFDYNSTMLEVEGYCNGSIVSRKSAGEGGAENNASAACPTLAETILTPIPVYTCINEDYVEMECCINPYVRDARTDECVVRCLQYGYRKDNEDLIRIFTFTLFWVDVILVILGLVPVVVMFRGNWTFPNYLSPLMIITSLVSTLMLNLANFTSPTDWVCRGEYDYTVAMLEFTESARCIIQAFLFQFTYLAYVFMNTTIALTAFIAVLGQSDAWKKRLYLPIRPSRMMEVVSQLVIWIIPFILQVVLMILVLTDDSEVLEDRLLLPSPGSFFCFANTKSFAVFASFIPLIIVNVIIIILSTAVILYILNNRKIFYLQWRFLVFSCYLIIMNCFVIIYVFYASYSLKNVLYTNAQCVSLNARDPSVCPYATEDNYFLLFIAFSLFSLTPGAYVSIIYLSQPLIWKWWGAVARGNPPPSINSGKVDTGSRKSVEIDIL